MVRRRPRERQTERDVHRTPERRHFYRSHPDIVIRRNDRVELTAHRSHKDRIRGIWSGYPSAASGGKQHTLVFIPEATSVSAMWVHRT
jgi:hypothetical protein